MQNHRNNDINLAAHHSKGLEAGLIKSRIVGTAVKIIVRKCICDFVNADRHETACMD